MKNIEFEKSSIPGQFAINLRDEYGINWVESSTKNFYQTLFATMVDVLKFNQNKEKPRIGISMKDEKGAFKIGAIMTYNKPEEDSEEDSGNWSLEFTLDKEDMNGLDLDLDNHSDVFVRCAAEEANNICYGRFRSTEIMYTMFNCALDTLIKFLDVNASETEEVSVELRGIFTASVSIENGEKVMAIVPGEYIKQLIKNDASL